MNLNNNEQEIPEVQHEEYASKGCERFCMPIKGQSKNHEEEKLPVFPKNSSLGRERAVACRECTLPRDEEGSELKGWIRGNPKTGAVLEVVTCCLHGKCGVEIRIWSFNSDDSHSWVRISHGSNKFVMDLNNNETEILEDQFEEYAFKLDAKGFACRSKVKAKP